MRWKHIGVTHYRKCSSKLTVPDVDIVMVLDERTGDLSMPLLAWRKRQTGAVQTATAGLSPCMHAVAGGSVQWLGKQDESIATPAGKHAEWKNSICLRGALLIGLSLGGPVGVPLKKCICLREALLIYWPLCWRASGCCFNNNNNNNEYLDRLTRTGPKRLPVL